MRVSLLNIKINNMTDRVKGFVVTLEKDIRIDDVQPIMDAIKMVKGVVAVEPSISDSNDIIIESRVRVDLCNKLADFIRQNIK